MACVGLGQLLYDRDAWLLRRFDPPVTLFSEGTESLYQADRLCEDAAVECRHAAVRIVRWHCPRTRCY